MASGVQLAHSDMRALYLMLGECCELGREPQAWFRRFHERFSQLAGISRSVFFDGHIDAAHGRRGPDANDRVSLFGWPPADIIGIVQDFFDNNGITQDPAMQAWGQLAGRKATMARTQLADSHEWYNSPAYCDYYRALGIDQFIVSINPLGGGAVSMIWLWRNSGDAPFQERAVNLLYHAHAEMIRLAGEGRLTLPLQCEPSNLTLRQQHTLWLLGEGLTEKEVAAEMRLSVYTVHDHIKALHRTLGVGNRGELVAFAHSRMRGT